MGSYQKLVGARLVCPQQRWLVHVNYLIPQRDKNSCPTQIPACFERFVEDCPSLHVFNPFCPHTLLMHYMNKIHTNSFSQDLSLSALYSTFSVAFGIHLEFFVCTAKCTTKHGSHLLELFGMFSQRNLHPPNMRSLSPTACASQKEHVLKLTS